MAVKSILDIEVNDAAFQKFAAQFAEYEKLLAGMPDSWHKTQKATEAATKEASDGVGDISDAIDVMLEAQGATVEAMEGAAAAIGVVAVESAKTVHAVKEEEVVRKKVSGHVKETVKETEKANRAAAAGENIERRRFARLGALLHGGASLAKWTGIGSLLLGGAGLFGIDRLAHSVFGQRRTALGMGISTGEASAFRVNYGQFVDPDALIGNVANTRNDLAQRWAFSALGINANQMAGMDNADLARVVTRNARDLWQRGPQTAQFAQARGLTQFFSLEDLRRLGAMSDRDMATAESRYGADRNALTVPDDVQREWVRFATQLRRSGVSIETTFVRGLAPVTPGLSHLSDGITHVIDAFMRSDVIQKGIKNLGDWLNDPRLQKAVKDFGDYLGSPQFTQAMRDFVGGVEAAAQKIASALRWLGLIPDGGAPGSAGGGTANQKLLDDYYRRVAGAASQPGGAPGFNERAEAWLRSHVGNPGDAARWKQSIGKASADYGLPDGLLWNLFGAESGYGRDLLNAKTGAMGGFQFMPRTAKELNIDPWNPEQASSGAAKYLKLLYAHFGDMRKAVAAYNWGPANLDADIAAHGSQWEQFAPRETQGELAKVFPPGGSLDAQIRALQPHQAPGGATAQATSATGSGDDLVRVLDRLRRQVSSRPSTSPVRVSISNPTASRVAVTANAVAVV